MDTSSTAILPAELINIIVQTGDFLREELKTLRRVNRAFVDAATPLLFGSIFFSPNRGNLDSWTKIAETQHLRKHVTFIYVDSTRWSPSLTLEHYAHLARHVFRETLDRNCFCDEDGGKLILNLLCNEASLLKVLRNETSGASEILSRECPAALREGIHMHKTLGLAQKRLFNEKPDIVWTSLTNGLKSFQKAKKVTFVDKWPMCLDHSITKYVLGAMETNGNDAEIESTVASSRSALSTNPWSRQSREISWKPSTYNPYPMPGSIARSLHPMHLPPLPAQYFHPSRFAQFFYYFLRAAHEAHFHPEELMLPVDGPVNDSWNSWSAWSAWEPPLLGKQGKGCAITLATFGYGPRPTAASAPQLFPSVFSELRALKLTIDPGTCSGSQVGRNGFRNLGHVASLIRSLRRIEDLAVFFDDGIDRYGDDLEAMICLVDDLFDIHATAGTDLGAINTSTMPLDDNPWPHMQCLALGGMAASDISLMTLLPHCYSTLTGLTLWAIELFRHDRDYIRLADGIHRHMPNLRQCDFNLLEVDYPPAEAWVNSDMVSRVSYSLTDDLIYLALGKVLLARIVDNKFMKDRVFRPFL